ncbi:MAG TPA: MauE/DoxX family redox-associated membrane protein [Phycisphaerales bacterium]|nr:MauE/DoxX family redox-associated membrane protein [Phycisphaerales bacterium]
MKSRFWRVLGRGVWSIAATWFVYMFTASGVRKLTDSSAFAASLRRFEVVPEEMVRPISLWIPILECLLGGLLAVSLVWTRLTAIAASACVGILLGFAAFLLCVAILSDAELPCGCLGKESPETVVQGAVRNVLLSIVLMLAGLAAWNAREAAATASAQG